MESVLGAVCCLVAWWWSPVFHCILFVIQQYSIPPPPFLHFLSQKVYQNGHRRGLGEKYQISKTWNQKNSVMPQHTNFGQGVYPCLVVDLDSTQLTPTILHQKPMYYLEGNVYQNDCHKGQRKNIRYQHKCISDDSEQRFLPNKAAIQLSGCLVMDLSSFDCLFRPFASIFLLRYITKVLVTLFSEI